MAPTAHARLSPSASKIWMACPGQPTLAANVDDTSSIHAERGTLAHKVLELCLSNGFVAKDFVASEARGTPTFNQEDADAVQIAIDWILGEVDEADEVGIEEKLQYNADFWGTCDVSRYRYSNQELLIVDYKHGSGVAVDAKNNPQGVSYALMKLKMLGNRGVNQVRFVIVQPRGFHEDGIIREFVVDGVDMLDWEDSITAAIAKVAEASSAFTKYSDAPWWSIYTTSGDHCRWCKAAATCPRLKDDTLRALETDFAPVVEAGGVARYDVAELAKSLSLIDRAKAWIKATDEFAYAEAERGVQIPGFKLVRKKAMAKWRDPAAVVEMMDLSGFDTTETHEPAELKSPAQLRAVLAPTMPGTTKKAREAAAKAALDELTDFVSSGHTLVPDSDPRPPIRGNAAEDFEAVA